MPGFRGFIWDINNTLTVKHTSFPVRFVLFNGGSNHASLGVFVERAGAGRSASYSGLPLVVVSLLGLLIDEFVSSSWKRLYSNIMNYSNMHKMKQNITLDLS